MNNTRRPLPRALALAMAIAMALTLSVSAFASDSQAWNVGTTKVGQSLMQSKYTMRQLQDQWEQQKLN